VQDNIALLGRGVNWLHFGEIVNSKSVKGLHLDINLQKRKSKVFRGARDRCLVRN